MEQTLQQCLLQIVNAFTERQKLGAMAESVLVKEKEDDNTKRFLSQMFCTGHRLAFYVLIV